MATQPPLDWADVVHCRTAGLPFCLNLTRYATLVNWIPMARGGGGNTGQHLRKLMLGRMSWEDQASGHLLINDQLLEADRAEWWAEGHNLNLKKWMN